MMSGGMRQYIEPFRLLTGAAVLLALSISTTAAFASGLDYETYKTRVEPVFLKKRPGHARCVVCHEANNSAFRLQPLKEGATAWTDQQSRMNFENVSHLVKPGDPDGSKLLIHPLAHDAGGDEFHGGGQQFKTKTDPEWKAIAAWVTQAK
jgi:hypothetical protein